MIKKKIKNLKKQVNNFFKLNILIYYNEIGEEIFEFK